MLKKINIYTLFFVLVQVFQVVSLHAQKAGEDFKKVNDAYFNSEKLVMEVEYKAYRNYTSKTAMEVQTGSFMKQGNKQFSNMMGIETLVNDKYRIIIDHPNKTILLTDPPPVIEKTPSVVRIDTLLSTASEVKYMELAGQQKLYTIYFESLFSEYEKIEVFINKNAFLEKMTLYYRKAENLDEDGNNIGKNKEKPKLEIIYKKTDQHPVFSKEQFNEHKYISVSGNTIRASEAYSAYRFINQKLK